MAITVLGTEGAANEITTIATSHAADDVLIVFADAENDIAPDLPTGFTNIASGTPGYLIGYRVCYKVATSSSETVPNMGTNTNNLILTIVRGLDTSAPIGSDTAANSANSATAVYGAITCDNTSGTSVVFGWGAHKGGSSDIETPPSGMSLVLDNRQSKGEAALHQVTGVTSYAGDSVGITASNGWVTFVLEAKEASSAAYTLAVTSAAVTATGSTIAPKAGRKVSVATSAVTLTGSSVALKIAKTLPVATQAVTLTGSTVALKVTKTVAVDTSAVTLTGSSVALTIARLASVDTSAVTLTGSSITLTVTAASTNVTLPVDTSAVTLTGSTVAMTISRVLAVDTNEITLTGSSVTLSKTGSLTLAVDSGAVTLTGSSITLSLVAANDTQPEVNWPGTTIPRSQFKDMQRAALARYLADERKRLEDEAQAKPTKRQVKKTAKRVIEQVLDDGLLAPSQIDRIKPAIEAALTSTISLDEIMARLARFEAEQMAIENDEAAAILLLLAA